jgi:hypothetical protein
MIALASVLSWPDSSVTRRRPGKLLSYHGFFVSQWFRYFVRSSRPRCSQYQGPITLDVLPEEIGELPDSDQYVSIEIIQPGERSGQRALLSVDRFNKLASSGDMPTILMNATRRQAGS